MLKHIILLLFVVSTFQLACNGTTGNYLSEHSLGQQDEINDTTAKICPSIILAPISNTFAEGTISLTSISLACVFYDGGQTAKAGVEILTVAGGKIQFQLNFNLTVNISSTIQKGNAYGTNYTNIASVFSDNTNLTKTLGYGSGSYLRWWLDAANTKNISITDQNFTMKRYSPANISSAAITAITDALNTVSGSAKEQITAQYNKNFFTILNNSLGQQLIFATQFNYIYSHSTKGTLVFPFRNNISKFDLNGTQGLTLEFNTYIKGQSIDCLYNMTKRYDYKQFGGIQSIHNMDLYNHIFNYSLKMKYFDMPLDSKWDTNSFQFMTGDLYDIIPQASSISPRTRLKGDCTAQNDSNRSLKRNNSQKITVTINYNCSLTTETSIKVADFDILVKYIVGVKLQYESVRFKILSATGTPTFRTSGQYIVTNFLLAQYKINEVLKSLIDRTVLGDGFPSWPRDFPNAEIIENGTLFYDSSHVPHFNKNLIES